MQLRIKLLFPQSQHKIFIKCKQEERSASTLAKPALSLLVPCGLMPRTQASPRPSCPMVQLIICSATRKLMLAYASLCLHNCRVSRPEPQWEGGLTDWLGIRGLGLDLKMNGPLRTWAGTPSAPLPVFLPVSRSCCGVGDPADCVDRDPADQHKHWHYGLSAGRQKLWRAVCGFMWVMHAYVCHYKKSRMHEDVNTTLQQTLPILYLQPHNIFNIIYSQYFLRNIHSLCLHSVTASLCMHHVTLLLQGIQTEWPHMRD